MISNLVYVMLQSNKSMDDFDRLKDFKRPDRRWNLGDLHPIVPNRRFDRFGLRYHFTFIGDDASEALNDAFNFMCELTSIVPALTNIEKSIVVTGSVSRKFSANLSLQQIHFLTRNDSIVDFDLYVANTPEELTF